MGMEHHTTTLVNKYILGFATLLAATNTYAANMLDWVHQFGVRPLVVATGGVLFTNDLGASKTFPIIDPITDQFFRYHPSNATRGANVIGLMLGGEKIVCPSWMVQLGLNYETGESLHASGNVSQGVDDLSTSVFRYHYEVFSSRLLLEGKLLTTYYANYFHPYISLGIGAAFNNAHKYGVQTHFLTFSRIYNSHRSTSFTYRVGLGADIDLNDCWRFGLGWRYANLGQVKLGKARIDTTPVSGTLKQNHLYANEFFAQLTYLM